MGQVSHQYSRVGFDSSVEDNLSMYYGGVGVPQSSSISYGTMQSRSLTLPKQCVMDMDHMIQDHKLGAKSHRKIIKTRLAKSRENLRSGIQYWPRR